MNCLSGSDATGSKGHRCTTDGCISLSCCKSDCTCLDPCDLMRKTVAQRHHGAVCGATTLDCAAPSSHRPPRSTSDVALSHTHTLLFRKTESQAWGLSEAWEWRHDINFHHLLGKHGELDTICPDKTARYVASLLPCGTETQTLCKCYSTCCKIGKFILVMLNGSPLRWCVHTQRSIGNSGKGKGFVQMAHKSDIPVRFNLWDCLLLCHFSSD